jgi:hypothetical protein
VRLKAIANIFRDFGFTTKLRDVEELDTPAITVEELDTLAITVLPFKCLLNDGVK